MKINFFVDNECHVWNSHNEIYIIREDQEVYFELTDLEDNNEVPLLFVEDYDLSLITYYKENLGKIFRSTSGRIFRESFGFSKVNVYLGEQHFELRFEVLVKKINAKQIEEMIQYLSQKHHDIIRICLSRTTIPMGTKEYGTTDPETLLNTVETFISTLINYHLELRHHLRKRLIPIRQPKWKSSQNSDIDPFDIIFNLDTLEPVIGEGDVIVNGRSFSIMEIEVTTLEPTANVKENSILLGGIYSMRRIITVLLYNINSGFKDSKIASHDREYESLKDVLLRLTSSNMLQRCEYFLLKLEEFIRYFENITGMCYQGEQRPIMTPFVRSSRVYRRLFEQLNEWYTLGEPSLDGRNFLVKLRSISKIYEFVALFKIIDYLHGKNWTVVDSHWQPDLEFVPSTISFEKDNLKLTLSYEAKILPYNENTKHFDLVDMGHLDQKIYNYKYRCPDFLLKLETNNKIVYLILDAKYSSAYTIKKYTLKVLYDKYFIEMAVYDFYKKHLKQDTILGVIALFPDKNLTSPVYIENWGKYGTHKKPIRFPIVTGLPVLPESDNVAYQVFDQIFELAEEQLIITSS